MQATAQIDQANGQSAHLQLPLLSESIERSTKSQHYLLDFGPVQKHLVDRIQSHAGKLQVADTRRDELTSAQWPAFLQSQISNYPNRRYQLVLSWDILNYLTTDQLQLLDRTLSKGAAPGMRLHALIRYSKPDMPSQPDRFKLINDHQVEQFSELSSQIKAPRYSPKALEKWMPSLKVDRTRLLGNGMQEFILRFGST